MEHYSARLERNFQDGDWLTRGEVAGVIATNSDRPLAQARFVNDIARRKKWQVNRADRYAPLYRYEDVKDYHMKRHPGRHPQERPSPGAMRQRKHRTRQLQKQSQ